jgi:hypothetical protein
MSDSAIQTDVPEAAATAAAPTEAPKSPREIALEQMEERHQRQMAESNGYELPKDDDDSAPAAQVDQVAAQMNDPVVTEAVPDRVRIKVDGVETEVALDEVVRQYQKNSSADRRLAEATRLLREAEATQARIALEQQEAQLRAQQQQMQQSQQATAATESTPAAPNVDAAGDQFFDALFEGDKETAYKALKEFVGGRQQPVAAPTLDINQITEAVTQQVQQKFALETALAQNQRDYPELYADPDMEALALTKIQRLREQDGSDFFTALDAVSREMANKFGWNAHADTGRQADPAPTTSNRTAKLEQKRGIDNVSSVNTKTTSTEMQPENPSDVIAAMKAARAGS